MKSKSSPKRRPQRAPKVTLREKTPASSADAFPIVGIGASAGGLEALEQFLGHVPAGSGLAYVVIQHMDPTHKGVLSALLQRATSMQVAQVKDRTRVRPDCVYVIPPNKDLSLLHGVLHLFEPAAPRGLRLPIDFFFHSLAQDRQKHSIGVILSGMGSDGRLGLRAIKERAGVVLVQEPANAKFDSMPRSAIETGLADIVAPAAELPGRLLAHLQHLPPLPAAELVPTSGMQSNLGKAIVLLRAHTGHDFSLYKRNTLYRRIERRMGIHQIDKMPTYLRYLQENPQELDLLFRELLIGVTSFFRDPVVWAHLRESVLPSLLESRAPGRPLRAWVPGCSTGEEAYSLAILLKETIDALSPKAECAVQIFATDLDPDAVEKARQGLFPATITSDLSAARLLRFFTKEERRYRVRKEIREMVICAQQNLIMDPPFTKLDLLSCRNLLIYLTPEAQHKLIPIFHYSLNPGGILQLGSAETVGPCTDLFAPLGAKTRLFRRIETGPAPEPVLFPALLAAGPSPRPTLPAALAPPSSLQSHADQLVLRRYARPTVFTNDRGDILYVSGRTGAYLEPAAGKADWNIFAMAREGLRHELAQAFQEALHRQQSVTLQGLTLAAHGGTQIVDVSIQRLVEPGPLQGLVVIVFSDVPAPPPSLATGQPPKPRAQHPRVAALEEELLRVRATARATHEEMQTAQEELRSANEELQSTNEELQSTNEELTTSKEEMQSMNEELQTMNTELQTKVDELSRASNDMKNLLDSTDIATLFLDNALNVRRFTPQTTKIIKLIPADLGRPITDLASDLLYPTLTDDVREVLRTLLSIEKPAAARDGRWFSVRIMPYRTMDERIDGVVLTFANITVAKTLEAKLRNNQSTLESHIAQHSARRVRSKRRAAP